MSVGRKSCDPMTLTRKLEHFPIGNIELIEHQQQLLEGSGGACHPHAWIEPEEWQALFDSGLSTLMNEAGDVIAWLGDRPDSDNAFTASDSWILRYPWDLLRANELFVRRLKEQRMDGDVHPSAVIEGVVCVGKGTRILPGVYIEGNVVIGENCKIGPNCYLRGNTSIGNGCHIGQAVEVKNSLILSRTNVGHLSYVGDSVLGESVNFGAGTIVSNLRHDGSDHRTMVEGVLVDTGRRKFGAVVGDGVHTGIHTTIYPGRKLWPGTSTRPGEVVKHDVKP